MTSGVVDEQIQVSTIYNDFKHLVAEVVISQKGTSLLVKHGANIPDF
jgi:hypothetical protein